MGSFGRARLERREQLLRIVTHDSGAVLVMSPAARGVEGEIANLDFRTLVLNAILWSAGGDVPPDGVPSETPTRAQLEANQDEPRPDRPTP